MATNVYLLKDHHTLALMSIQEQQTGKNIIICLDGTGNQFGENLSNVVNLFRMLERTPGKQIAYYDPGVGTMGDPAYKTVIGRKLNKILGLAFGQGLMNNLIEAYTFLMEHYEDGDKVFIFGFSRGAYTARALAAFIKDCGLFEKGAKNLLPYAMNFFLTKAPKNDKDQKEFFSMLSSFRSTYGRLLNREGDPRDPKNKDIPNYQLRIHFMGLFDTVKSYGWVSNPVVLRNEAKNPSVLTLRHALSIDEKRAFFRQMHWKASKKFQDCKEVWFAGDHSDVGGGYPEQESGLAKIALEWMVHEAIPFGLRINPKRYGYILQKELDHENNWMPSPIKKGEEEKYSRPNPTAKAHESLKGAWKPLQFFPRKLEFWETTKSMRTIKSEKERLQTKEDLLPFRVHQSVLDRINANIGYQPKNLLLRIGDDISRLPKEHIEQTGAIKALLRSKKY